MGPFLSGFADELGGAMLKEAFGPAAAHKVLQLAKAKTLPKAAKRVLGEVGHLAVPAKQTSTSARSLTRGKDRIIQDTKQYKALRDISDQAKKQRAKRKKNPRKKSSVIGQVLDEASERMPVLPRVPASSKKMREGVFKGHELDELGMKGRKRQKSSQKYGHLGWDVILREHNRVVTLPKAHESVGKYMRALRNIKGAEAEALRRAGVEFGKGPRLSRHARRRIADRIEKQELAGAAALKQKRKATAEWVAKKSQRPASESKAKRPSIMKRFLNKFRRKEAPVKAGTGTGLGKAASVNSPMMFGFADELLKIGALPGAKATVPMPPVAGGRPEYKASGSFKPKMPKIEAPGPMKTAALDIFQPDMMKLDTLDDVIGRVGELNPGDYDRAQVRKAARNKLLRRAGIGTAATLAGAALIHRRNKKKKGATKTAEAGAVSDKLKAPSKPPPPKMSRVMSKPKETPRLGAEFAKLTPSQKKTELAVPGAWTTRAKAPDMDSPDPKMPSMSREESKWWKQQEAAGKLPSQARASQTEAEWKARHPKPTGSI